MHQVQLNFKKNVKKEYLYNEFYDSQIENTTNDNYKIFVKYK